MWTAISRAAHHVHMGLAGLPVTHGGSRKLAKAVQREEYGPGQHRDGLPETLPVRRLLRTSRHLQNLRAILHRDSPCAIKARAQLLVAIRNDLKLCPQSALACSWALYQPDSLTLDTAITLTQSALVEARRVEREARRDKWHAWLTDQAGRGSGAVYRWIRDGPTCPHCEGR